MTSCTAVLRYRLMDLFAGCGGMTRGFADSGRFEPVFAVEVDADAAETYAANFDQGGAHLQIAPIQEVEGFARADVVVGGPPCQGFSALNRGGVGLERRSLWQHYLRALTGSEAQAFVMENVPPLLKAPEFAAFKQAAGDLGFVVDGRVLLAADFGVPQLRSRAIVVGTRGSAPVFPNPTHHDPSKPAPFGTRPWVTFEHAMSAEPAIPPVPDGARWHIARRPQSISLERYRTIPGPGEGRFELAERRPDITPRCWLEKPAGTTDVFGRMWADRPSPTIRTEFFKPEKGRYLHPTEHRPITVREAARLMSFPDDFVLLEHQSLTSVGRQVGNAVPCLLAQRIAEALADALDGVVGRHEHPAIAA